MGIITGILKKFLGTKQERDMKRYFPRAAAITLLEPDFQRKTDAELREMTDEFRKRLAAGETPQSFLNEAFATVREMSKRRIGLRHYDVQLVGGMVLYEGKVAEMATGEGKTLVATLAAYLEGLSSNGVHIVTTNDYLARRDREWMGPVYESLGLTVGAIQHDMDSPTRQAQYACDITYGTNNEYGFDYLRDNMALYPEYCVQRNRNYAIVDEVDSILIDEARTPLIISGPAEESTDKYYRVNNIVTKLKRGVDFMVDEENHSVHLTEDGNAKASRLLGADIFSEDNLDLIHHIQQALVAHNLKRHDVDYIVKDGEVVIVDEFTGRLMPGRRWSDGLHQAIEAKEGMKIQRENQTLATITIQNYFRLYARLAGMTGTADTEAVELKEIYKLDVVVIPTNRPLVRHNYSDVVYKTVEEKYDAVVEEIVEQNRQGRPILVGTCSIENSEHLSTLMKDRAHWKKQVKNRADRLLRRLPEMKLDGEIRSSLEALLAKPDRMSSRDLYPLVEEAQKTVGGDDAYMFERFYGTVEVCEAVIEGLPHHVLNAKHHEQEAEIVAQAGRKGAITIATNMAGRGVDILLGGNPDMLAQKLIPKTKKEDPDAQKTAVEEARRICSEEKKEVVEAGGLHIIGTERHESRRIDNQLRGRSGRQGDPGSSRFFLSLSDDLMRIFGGDRMKAWVDRLAPDQDVVLEHRFISKRIEAAQKRVETRNFDTRKHVLKYDDVMENQREVVYSIRQDILIGKEPKELLLGMFEDVVSEGLSRYAGDKKHVEQWNMEGLSAWMKHHFDLDEMPEFNPSVRYDSETLVESLMEIVKTKYDERDLEFEPPQAAVDKLKEILQFSVPDASDVGTWDQDALKVGLAQNFDLNELPDFSADPPKDREDLENRLEDLLTKKGLERWRNIQRWIILQTLDEKWKDHLRFMDHLKDNINLRAYGQKDPVIEYSKEGYEYFEEMRASAKREITGRIFRIRFDDNSGARRERRARGDRGSGTRRDIRGKITTAKRSERKIGRNEPCPCGSGKKYKYCCG